MSSVRASAWGHALAVIRPALVVGDHDMLGGLRRRLEAEGIARAVVARDTPALFDWLLGMAQLQGISDANAEGFTAKHGAVRWTDIDKALAAHPDCHRLKSYWHMDGCRYRKGARTCAAPALLWRCPVPRHPLRNGRLAQGAYSLFLFFRDVCDADLVGWIDHRLAGADEPHRVDRADRMRDAVLAPLTHIFGVSNKVLSMALADLLLGGDPDRERWVATGACMIAIDTLVHNFLARTGVLTRFDAEHACGPGCYVENGCAAILAGLATRIDARTFNPTYPAIFSRFVQQSIWRFCAAGERNICNGNRIYDRFGCRNGFCPAYQRCDRLPIHQGPARQST